MKNLTQIQLTQNVIKIGGWILILASTVFLAWTFPFLKADKLSMKDSQNYEIADIGDQDTIPSTAEFIETPQAMEASQTTQQQVTYTTNGNCTSWTNNSCWVGMSPGSSIGSSDVVNVLHNMVYDEGAEMVVDGTVHIGSTTDDCANGNITATNDNVVLTIESSTNIKVKSTGTFTLINGALLWENFGCNSFAGEFINEGGCVTVIDSRVDVHQNWSTSSGGKRHFERGCLRCGENYNNGGTLDTLINTCVEVGFHGSGNIENTDATNSKIHIIGNVEFLHARFNDHPITSCNLNDGSGNFSNSGTITGATGASIIGLETPGNISNSGTWNTPTVAEWCAAGSEQDVPAGSGNEDCSHFDNRSCGPCIPCVEEDGLAGPCDATRWESGGAWNNDFTIDDNTPAGDATPDQVPGVRGIIKCASAASTQSNIDPNSCYDSDSFTIDVSGLDCVDPSNGNIVSVENPTSGEPIIWLNFDVRANAGTFDIQVNDNSGDNIGWALFSSNNPAPGVFLNPSNGEYLSGDCDNLTLRACGAESSSTWNTLPVPNFAIVTNYYIAVWDQDADGDLGVNNFKARYGCGGSGFCFLDTTSVTTVCEANTYKVTVDIAGLNGTFVLTDNTGQGTNITPSSIALTNPGDANPVTTGTFMISYPFGVNYDFTISETTGAPETPNVPCMIDVTGTAPCCPNCMAGNTGPICTGESVTLSETGGYATNWVWSNVNGTATFDDVNAQNPVVTGAVDGEIFQVVTTDAAGCTSTCTTTVTVNDTPVCNITGVQEICDGQSISEFCADEVTGATYSWTGPGGFTANTRCTGAINVAGTYTVIVTLPGNCTSTCDRTLTLNPAPTCVATDGSVSCNGDTDGTVSVSASGGTPGYSYNWEDDLNPGASIGTGTSVSNLGGGTYNVTVTDSKGCIAVCSAMVIEPPVLMTTCTTVPANGSLACNGDTNGEVMVLAGGGTPGYTYLWDDANASTTATVSGLGAGTYSVTVTDANNCTAVCSITLTEPDPVTATCSSNHTNDELDCNGDTDGEVTVTPGGGTPGYTYQWDDANNSTTQTVSGLGAGTYSVTVTDANNCTAVCSITLTEPDPVTATCSSNHTNDELDCNGDTDGEVTVTPGGGTPGYTYQWDDANNSTTQTVSGLGAGTYSVTVTDANNCTAVCSITLMEPDPVTATCSSNHSNDELDCNGDTDGEVTVTPGGGTPGHTYQWDDANNSTTQTVSGLGAGTYSVTVTDANNCTAVCSITLTEPDPVTATCSSNHTNDELDCNGDTDGEVTVTPGGGTPGYTYQWDDANNSTTQTVSGLGAGTYSVTVTDANNCTAVCSITLTEPDPVTATCSSNHTNDELDCNGDTDGEVTVTPSGGTPGYTYQWDDVNNSTTQTVSGLGAGTYSVTVTDANNCTAVCSITLTEPDPVTATCSSNHTNDELDCNGDTDGEVTVTPGGGTPGYTYQWDDVNNSTTQTVSGLGAGTYSVTVTDANNCTAVCSITLTEPDPVTATCSSNHTNDELDCNGDTDGEVMVTPGGGTPGYTYQWDDANNSTTQTVSGLGAGTYSVTVMDANNCTAVCSITLTEPDPVTATCSSNHTNDELDCNGDTDGEVTVTPGGGTPGYTYQWDDANNSTTQTVSGLGAGTYSVTVTDANNCTAVCSITLTEPDPVTATCSSNHSNDELDCNGDTDGEVTVTPGGGTPGHTYQWDDANNSTTQTVSGLGAGTYSVTVTDANNCTAVCSITLTEPDPVTATCSSNHTNDELDCNGDTDGEVTVTPGGGTPGYTYQWDDANNSTTQTVSGLGAGTYSVTVTDANNCTAVCSITLTEPDPVTATCSSNHSNDELDCNGDTDGEVTVTPGGGTPGYTYQWDDANNSTTQTVSGLGAGTYSVTVTDANNCTAVCSITLTEPDPVTATCSSNHTNDELDCNGDTDGEVTVTPGGGTPGYTYQWDDANNSTTQTVSGLGAGTYSVTVTDANNCTAVCSITLTEPDPVTATCSSNHSNDELDCNGDTDGEVTVTPGGGTPGYTYQWDDANNSTTQTVSGLGAGTYSVTVTDANNCTAVCSITLTEPDPVTATCSSNHTNDELDCNGDTDGEVTVTPGGGTPGYTYQWDDVNNSTTQTVSGLGAGTYSVTVTDANGCQAFCSITLTEPDILECNTGNINNETCNNTNDGSFELTIEGGIPIYDYSIIGPTMVPDGMITINGGTVTIAGLMGGTYTINVIDANNCVTTCVAIIITGDCQIEIVKDGTLDDGGDGVADVGDEIDYTFEVTNTGNVTLSSVVVTDNMVAVVNCPQTTLIPGQSMTCTGTYVLTQADIDAGQKDNIGTVTGDPPSGPPVTDTDPHTEPLTPMPDIEIVKDGTLDDGGDGVTDVGDEIDYTFEVTNTGNVTLSSVVVTDNMVAVVNCPQTTLIPGQSMTCTGTYVLTQADIDAGQKDNIGTVTGDPPSGPPVTDTDPHTEPLTPMPDIEIVKDGTLDDGGDGVVDVGDEIDYTFEVTNTGNVTLSSVVVTDNMVAVVNCPQTTLIPGQSMTCTGTYVLTQADIDAGQKDNIGTVTGDPPSGPPVTDTDPHTEPLTPMPDIEIVKDGTLDDGGDGVTDVGDEIDYTFEVTNTGNVTLSSVVVTDNMVAVVNCPQTTLIPGQSMTCTGTYVLTQADIDAGQKDNIGTVTGDPPSGPPVTDTDPHTEPLTPMPDIEIVKDGTLDDGGDGVTDVGDEIDYTFEVTNTGNVTLSSVVVTDNMVAVVNCPQTTLIPGQSMTCTGTYVLTQADIDAGQKDNIGTVTGDPPSGPPVTDTDPHTEPLTPMPDIEIVKDGTLDDGGDGVADVGDEIDYTFEVTNTGNVTLSSVVVTDNMVAVVNCPQTTLIPGQSMTCTGTYVLTQADIDAGQKDNIGTVTGDPPSGPPVTDTDPHTEPLTPMPDIEIVKDGTLDDGGDGVTDVGDEIDYTFEVTNTGNVTLSSVVVTDNMVAVVNCPQTTLIPGQSMTCTGTYVLTQADIDAGQKDNIGTVTGDPPSGPPVTDTDPHTEPLTPMPDIEIVKDGTLDDGGDGVADVGDEIDYTFEVTNTGNVTLSSVVVTDNMVAVVNCPQTTLIPGQSMTCTGTYVLTQADIDAGQKDNIGTVTGDPPSGPPVTDTDPHTEPLTPMPDIEIVKDGTLDDGGDGVADVGDEIDYTFEVTNTGNVTLSSVVVTDNMVAVVNCPQTTLIPGQSMTCTGTYVLTQADIDAGQKDNIGTVTGDPPSGPPVTDTDPHTEPLTPMPDIEIVKDGTLDDGGDGVADVGDEIDYTFEVTNTGNVTLSSVVVTDNMVAVVNCPQTTLIPGQSMTCTGTYVLTQADIDAGQKDNIGTVTGDPPSGPPVTDTDPHTEPLTPMPDIEIVKDGTLDDGGDGVADVGDEIDYTFEVTNTGNVTLSSVVVTDNMVAVVNCPQTTLIPGQSMTCTGTYVLTQADIDAGQKDNIGTVTGDPPSGPPVTDTDPHTEPLTPMPDIEIVKDGTLDDGGDGVADVGDEIDYTFEVTNTGNVTLTNVIVTDPIVTNISCPQVTLLPGEMMTCIGSYVITQIDINTGQRDNTATVTGDPPTGLPVDDMDTHMEPISQLPQIGISKMASPTIIIGNGVYETTITLNVENLGNTNLVNVQVIDDLNLTFPSPATFIVTVPPIATGDFDANLNYNGDLDINLLLSANSTLDVGEIETIEFTIQFQPNGVPGPFQNTAIATAEDPNGNPTMDESDDGTDPDPDGDNNPDESGENDPTPIPIPMDCSIVENTPASCNNSNDGSATVTANGGNGNYSYLWDNGETTATATMLSAGLHVVTVEDSNGNSTTCEVIISVDCTNFAIICPPDMNVNCADDIVIDINAVTVTGCAQNVNVYVTQPVVNGTPDCDATTYTYKYKAVNSCGDVVGCEQVFTIQNDGPEITCLPGETVTCFDDIVVDESDATVSTSCALGYTVTIVMPPVINGEIGCLGTEYIYTYRVEDDCGRIATCERTFTNGANDGPTIECMPNKNIACDWMINTNPANVTVTTSCNLGYVVTVTGPVPDGPLNCPGTNYTVTYTVEDACGRTASCDRVLTIANDAPVMNCPANCVILNCEDGDYLYIIDAWLASVTATSACDGTLEVSNDYDPANLGYCIWNGFTPVNFTAADACGRTTTCQGMIVITDTENPEFTIEPQDELDICNYNTVYEFNAWVAAHGNAIAEDGCWEDNITWSTIPPNPTIDCIGNPGPTEVTVTFVATDGCDNSASASATFTALPDGNFAGEGKGDLTISLNNSSMAVSFDAEKVETQVELTWSVSTEEEVDHYFIERSLDSTYFYPIAMVDIKNEEGAVTHKEYDKHPENARNYYRIKLFYEDGTEGYTDIRMVVFAPPEGEFQIFPNPTDDVLFIDLRSIKGDKIDMKISSQYGDVILKRKLRDDFERIFEMDLRPYQLMEGVYIVTIKSKIGVQFKKFVFMSTD